MYIFPDDIRKAYESQPIAMVYDQLIEGKVVPLLVTDGFCELVGLDRAHAMEWFRDGQYERLHPDDVGRVRSVSRAFARHRSGYDVIFRARHEDGYHILHAIGKWQTMPDGTELAVLTYSDLSDNFDEMSGTLEDYHLFRTDEFYTDPLTGLPILNYMIQFADERVQAIWTQGKTPVLIYADVISMHYYNSQYRFEKGNDLLKLIAGALKEEFPQALVMRGPDDHFILIDAFESQEQARERIISLDNRIQKEAEGNTTGIKAGACVFEGSARTYEIHDRARNALKWAGTDLNSICYFYTSNAEDQFWNERYIVENIDRALKNGHIRVYYQVISRLSTEKASFAEALARWVDPVRGILSPAEFIPVLEKYHLLYKLDLYMVEQVCMDIPRRAAHGLPIIPVSVNFSAQDFDYIDIPSELDRIYRQYCPDLISDRKNLIVEITEQDMAQAQGSFHEQLSQLRKLGFSVWLDDFGSAYSSLNVFSRFDVDLIKFDMDLLRHLDDRDGVNRRIMKAMTQIAREMRIHTLAEGMETEKQKAFLKEIGCEFAQGYLFHKPEPLESILYRIDSGQKPRPCETPREREILVREWFEKTEQTSGFPRQ